MNCSNGYLPEQTANFGGTLETACLASIENLDPQRLIFKTDHKAASIVYEGLTAFTGKGDEPQPCLAERWILSGDRKRVTFFLRDSVFFHDDPCFPDNKGRKFNADDVIYTFHRLADASTECPEYSMFTGKIIGIDDYHLGHSSCIAGIEKIDSLTISFNLTRPYTAFLKYLATHICYIIPREAVTYYGDSFAYHPVGTGAFRLSRWKQLEALYFERHPGYWKKNSSGQKLPYLNTIRMHLISRPVIVLSELYKGNLDLAALNQQQFIHLKNRQEMQEMGLIIQSNPSYNIRFFAFSLETADELGIKRDLRQAIALGFNRTTLQDSIKPNLAQTFVPPHFLPDNKTRWYNYDPIKSKTTAAHSGYRKAPLCIASNIESEEVIQLNHDCLQIGLNSNIFIKKSDYYAWVFKKRPLLFRVSFHPPYPDPEACYNLFYSKNKQSNITGYHNKDFDRLFESCLSETDSLHRFSAFLNMEKLLKQDVPILLLTNEQSVYHILNSQVNGFQIHFNIEDYSQVWLGKRDENPL